MSRDNLDIGFSLRVHGAIEFKHGYFGETDETGIDWFSSGNERIFTPAQLDKLIETEEDLDRFKAHLDDAVKAGSQQVQFGENLIDISDKGQIDTILEKIKNKLEHPEEVSNPAKFWFDLQIVENTNLFMKPIT